MKKDVKTLIDEEALWVWNEEVKKIFINKWLREGENYLLLLVN